MVITSIANEKVKFLRSLADAKTRKKEGLYIAEGANLIKDIPSPESVRMLFVKESKRDSFEDILNRFSARMFTQARSTRSIS